MNDKILKRTLQILFQIIMIATILFVSSGRLDWWMAWIYISLFIIGVSINMIILVHRDSGLIEERSEIKADTKKWDFWLAGFFSLMSSVTLLISGLDIRFGWSEEIPSVLQFAAMVLVALGSALGSWAILSNPFFASTVRIQSERGHAVISHGPYHYVRHPGYSGWILTGMALPVMLGSLWALIPAGLTAIILIIRTGLEDWTLRRELPGYEEYSQNTHFRLVPYVW
ncbi:MAG: isoprenylcysteine carboxylmethyltransferase family protein [Candidatus Aminicenantes bacterium]|nr:isoprenylcysteine carboxylmethyltransferase family protein [Candidatus Aminicenantes bacterium]MDH5466071.1 isoprenylcysteine carboxylmethyltransferase family protein [Candidatus Aminicenantes bacterium]